MQKTLDRFFSKVVKTDSCWIWKASGSNGYGRFYYKLKFKMAHRVSLNLIGVEIPDGMHVDHICKNRLCVNPDHLRIVTPKINVTENSLSLAAINKNKTHCKWGHEFNDKNTGIINKRNSRVCKKCQSNRAMKSYYKSKDMKAIEVIKEAADVRIAIMKALGKELSEANSRINELEKDRERLEWMIENEALVTSHRHEELYFCETRVRRNSFMSVSGKTPREAIDAAMKASEK